MSTEEARKLRKTFTGREADGRIVVKLPGVEGIPSPLTHLGKVHSITYEIAKDHDTGDVELYEHHFREAEAQLASLPDGQHVLFIFGDFLVLEEGITDTAQARRLGYDV